MGWQFTWLTDTREKPSQLRLGSGGERADAIDKLLSRSDRLSRS